ncbi:MAG: enoyl-CoA hydratase/isomerase family protein [Pseudomonadota bacterium]|nr:enoyl-CoA hydratase/isomerase family protein [Pseudomonadota bacterium]
MAYQDFRVLQIVLADGVAKVVIDNPPLNILDGRLLQELDRFAGIVRGDGAVRVIVFESADRDFFMPHGDMKFVDDPESFASLQVAMDEDSGLNPMQRVFERVRKLPQATIGKLAGYARGGGAEFLAALDMRFAGRERGKLAQMEALTGIIPGAGATVYLPPLMGRARTLEAILGAGLFDAPLAERYGWINRAIPDAELDTFVSDLATRIARLAPGVIAAAKIAVDATSQPMLEALKVQNQQLGATFDKPAAGDLTRAALEAGAQTRDGERHLEELLNALPPHQ